MPEPTRSSAVDDAPLALVTGASSGLGEAVARRLSADGYRVILVARRADRLKALAAELPGALVAAVDLTDEQGPAKLAAAVDAAGGRLDVLVNNAGFGGRGTFGEIGFEGYRRVMVLNFDAQLRVTEALLPAVRAAKGSILIVSSVAGRISRPGAGAYSATKFALSAWADALRGEEAAFGVHVGVILPGFIATEGFPQRELVEKRLTRRLVGKPDHVADAAAHLLRTRKPERHAPRLWKLPTLLVAVAPGLIAKVTSKSSITPTATD